MSDIVCDQDALEKVGFKVRGIGQILRTFAAGEAPGEENEDAYVILADLAEEAADYIRAHVKARA